MPKWILGESIASGIINSTLNDDFECQPFKWNVIS